jgi:hypothetical protein
MVYFQRFTGSLLPSRVRQVQGFSGSEGPDFSKGAAQAIPLQPSHQQCRSRARLLSILYLQFFEQKLIYSVIRYVSSDKVNWNASCQCKYLI